MKKVMEQAQQLAEAIVDSDIYRRMHEAEMKVTKDEAAAKAISAFIEKRQAVEGMLADNNLDKDALAKAGEDMEAAEKALNEIPLIKEMQESRQSFTDMMNGVNQILRLIITGETGEEEGCGGSCESCGGSCESCGGCH